MRQKYGPKLCAKIMRYAPKAKLCGRANYESFTRSHNRIILKGLVCKRKKKGYVKALKFPCIYLHMQKNIYKL